VLVEVQRLRGVHATMEVQRAVRTRAELRDDVLRLIDEEYTPEELDAQNRLLRTLRLLEPDQDYISLMIDLLEDQVAGFYDHRSKTFYLMREGDAALQEPVMSHELYHAVQDQIWGIERVQGPGASRISDLGLARSALIEGDALAVMMQYMLGEMVQVLDSPFVGAMLSGAVPSGATAGGVVVPDFMWQQLVYPYTYGLSFVLAVGGEGRGWRAVDRIYFDPPHSTEQVLHPSRYLERDEPTWLEFDSWEADGGEVLLEDILGEFMLRTVLRQMLGRAVSAQAVERAAEGWDGDRLRLRVWGDDTERERLTWLTVWDSEADAQQFARVAARLGETLLGREMVRIGEGTHGGAWETFTDEGALRVEQWGDLVAVVLARHSDADAAMHEVRRECDVVLETVERSRYPSEL
jgi:hypothetical protein